MTKMWYHVDIFDVVNNNNTNNNVEAAAATVLGGFVNQDWSKSTENYNNSNYCPSGTVPLLIVDNLTSEFIVPQSVNKSKLLWIENNK